MSTLNTVIVMSPRAARAAVSLGVGLLGAGLFNAACSSSPRAEPATLSHLELAGAQLVPAFSPGRARYQAELGLLAHSVRLTAEASTPGASIHVNGDSGVPGSLSQEVELHLGENTVDLAVTTVGGQTEDYTVAIVRRSEPWQYALELRAEEPSEDGFFGDYLRASGEWLYVNASRRGLLYRREGARWVFDRTSETLFSVELEWMYEAALSEDALAIVAQPAGGNETLFTFLLEDGSWIPAGEFETGAQGTVRLSGDDLVFVAAEGVRFFRREAGTYRLSQTLPAPADDIGFGERPTYFDAPGVALDEDVLIVGAPRESSPATGVDGSRDQDCSTAGGACAFRSGAVFVYERSAGRWDEAAYLKPPSVSEELGFGSTAVLEGTRILVGCSHEGSAGHGESSEARAVVCSEPSDDCLPESGAVYVYQREAGSWRAKSMLKASLPHAYDYFGDTLLVSGDVLLVGAPGQDSGIGAALDDTTREDSGGVFAFVDDGSGFRELGIYKLAEDMPAVFPFPASLEASWSQLLVASNQAPFDDGGATLVNAGAVYYLY